MNKSNFKYVALPYSILVLAFIAMIILMYIEDKNTTYISVKIKGNARVFEGEINGYKENGEVKKTSIKGNLPKKYRIKAKAITCQIKLVSGDYIFVEYWSKGKLLDSDTITSGLYNRKIEVD